MKKLLLALSLLLFPAFLYGQETVDVSVTTSILDAFSLTKVSDLTFGNVQASDVVTVNPLTAAITNGGQSASVGKVTATATSPLVYTFSANTTLTGNDLTLNRTVGSSGAADVTVTLSFGIGETSPVAYTPGTSTGASDSDGNTLWIGGTFTAPSSLSVGNSYSATITVSAIYL
jgi:hypothetical protein